MSPLLFTSSPSKAVSAGFVSIPKVTTSDLALPQLNALDLASILPRRSSTPPTPSQKSSRSVDLKMKCSSGPSRQTHSTLSTCTSTRRGTIKHHDVYLCSNAVNAPRLVALTREAMDAQVQSWGGNAMVDESWSYTIRQRKAGHGRCFKVSVDYTGVVAQCDRPDPHRPVALEAAKGIPGLMTILSRE